MMELQSIIDHVFGHDFLQASLTSLKENETTSLLGNVSHVMNKKLNSASRPFSYASFASADARPGRLGHKQIGAVRVGSHWSRITSRTEQCLGDVLRMASHTNVFVCTIPYSYDKLQLNTIVWQVIETLKQDLVALFEFTSTFLPMECPH